MTPAQRQAAVMAYVDRFWCERCYSPNTREIMAGCGIPSTSVVRYTLDALQAAGYLTVDYNVARSIVPDWVRDLVATTQEADHE